LRIAILGPAPPFRGGISLFALMLARAFRAADHEVAFFNFASQYPKLLFPGKDQFDNALDANEFPNYRILTLWLPLSWVKTATAIKAFKADLILVSWFLPFFAPAYGWILRRCANIPKVIVAHNIAAHENWTLSSQLLRYCFHPATRIVVLSKATLQELKQKLPLYIAKRGVQGFHPIYDCYVQVSQTVLKSATDLLFFGLIKPYKGLDLLIDAMALVIKQIPEAKLVIAGEVYGDDSIYHKQIQALGLGKAIETHFRYISEPEISSFFGATSLCILPYKSASQSGVIATAYSFGVPVLASDVGGLGEYIIEGETGYLVPPNDPEKLAIAIVKHLQNKPDMRSSIAEYREQYSWNKLTELMLAT
jgi:glycosyltransferase involved in cell wall biosynthesis